MFTFSVGFEAATLKIPNKDSTAYGPGATGSNSSQPSNAIRIGSFPAGYPQSTYSIPNDQYNLVGLNQIGDQSWPPGTVGTDESTFSGTLNSTGGHSNNATGGTTAPRKQIIGFAKFRTRADALSARDLLQGRRVDIEKGAVLKAEMAKKNLHTKRGVGPLSNLPLPSIVTNSNGVGSNSGSQNIAAQAESLPSLSSLNGLSSLVSPAVETLSARDRELGTLGAMGLGGNLQRRDRYEGQQEDNDSRRRREVGTMSVFNPRGPRERAEDDERERERRKKEKDMRLRSMSSATFEAFHSVNDAGQLRSSSSITTPQSSALGSLGSAILSPSESLNSYPFPSVNLSSSFSSEVVGGSGGGGLDTWTDIRRTINNNGGVMSIHSSLVANESLRSSSPRPFGEVTSEPPISQPLPSHLSDNGTNTVPYSPSLTNISLSQQAASTHRSSSQFSPSDGDTLRQGPLFKATSVPMSSASSVTGSQGSGGSSIEEEMTSGVCGIRISTSRGSVSPQLPSPGSGGSGPRSNGSDQNPPVR